MSHSKEIQADLAARFAQAQHIINAAGELAHEFFINRAELTVEHKGLQDVVSIADKAVEQLIRDQLNQHFPEDGFLGEENAVQDIADFKQHATRFIWVVDPIDGTALFLNGIPCWCVSIALLVDNQIVMGLIYDPCNKELFCAQQGAGAYVNNQRISVATASSVTEGMVGVGFSHRVGKEQVIPFLDRLLEAGGIYVRNGSGALSLAYVAAGRLIGYYEPHINSWDCLAGILLITEAGGRVNDFLADDGLAQGNLILCATQGIAVKLESMLTETENC